MIMSPFQVQFAKFELPISCNKGSIINVGVLKGDDFGAPTFFAKKRAWS